MLYFIECIFLVDISLLPLLLCPNENSELRRICLTRMVDTTDEPMNDTFYYLRAHEWHILQLTNPWMEHSTTDKTMNDTFYNWRAHEWHIPKLTNPWMTITKINTKICKIARNKTLLYDVESNTESVSQYKQSVTLSGSIYWNARWDNK